jgi:hypothetical protein
VTRPFDPASGLGALQPHDPAPCLICGHPTQDRYVTALLPRAMGMKGDDLPFATIARCPDCERARTIAQAKAIMANEAVHPHLRAAAEASLQAGTPPATGREP